MTRDWETLLPLLVHIQAHLEDDLGLDVLSRKAGLSPFYLQRLFKAAIGETPKAYTSRLRLERGAFRLLVHDSNVLDIALECGFQSHETFLRAFRRRFGRVPSDYREWVRGQLTAWEEPAPEDCPETAPAFEISATKVITLRPAHLAFRRHVGPYESVPESLFDELEEWASAARAAGSAGLDGDRARRPRDHSARAAPLRRGAGGAGSLRPRGAHRLPAPARRSLRRHDPCGTVRHAAGCLRRDLPAPPGAPPVTGLVGLPAVEIYHTTRVNVRYRLNHTDLCLPVAACP